MTPWRIEVQEPADLDAYARLVVAVDLGVGLAHQADGEDGRVVEARWEHGKAGPVTMSVSTPAALACVELTGSKQVLVAVAAGILRELAGAEAVGSTLEVTP